MELNVVVTQASGPQRTPPVVFVHGAWHGAWCWAEYFAEFFAEHGYTSYAIDLRGHGDSQGSVRTARIPHYVHDVRRLALELDADPVIVGHSMGGLVVQQYLSRYRAAGGVLMAPVPTRGAIGATLRVVRDHPWSFARANASLSLGPIVDEPERAMALLFGPQMDRTEALRFTAQLQDESYPAYLEMITDLPRPARVQDPVLIMGAEHDIVFAPTEIRATARAYGVEATIFPDMGHDMMLEPAWRGPAQVIIDWLHDLSAIQPQPPGTAD